MFKHTRPYILLALCLIIGAGYYTWLQIPSLGGAIDIYAKQVMNNPQEYSLPGEAFYNNYAVYNLTQPSEDCYECTLMIYLTQTAEEQQNNDYPAALQTIRLTKNGLGWQAQPQSDFRRIILRAIMLPHMLPMQTYVADWGDFHIIIYQQTETDIYNIYNNDSTPKPKTKITFHIRNEAIITYTGAPEDKAQYKVLGVSYAPMNAGEERPQLERPFSSSSGTGSNNLGNSWHSKVITNVWDNEVKAKNWDNEIFMGGGGTALPDDDPLYVFDCYALDFYINGKKTAELTLLPVEED